MSTNTSASVTKQYAASMVSTALGPSLLEIRSTRHPLEITLLLLCARGTRDPFAEARIRALLQRDVDWDYLIITAHQHRVLPLLYRTLIRMSASVPEAVVQRLRAAFQANLKRNLALTAELLRILDIFQAHGIPSIPYKGPMVASYVYGDLSLRQFADLDIIVPPNQVARAKALLLANGYQLETALSDKELRLSIETNKDITLIHDGLGMNLEIHWGITTENDPVRIAPESLWENLGTHALAGRRIQTFQPEQLLLILCIHGAKHHWARLLWLCDIAQTIGSQRSFGWDTVIGNARRLRSERILLLGVALASELLAAELPVEVLQSIEADPVLKALSGQVKDWIFSEDPVLLNLGKRERYFMRLREHPSDRCRIAIKQARAYLAPTSRDREALPLPRFLEWSHYLLRPIRLATEYGLTPFTRFFRGLFQS